MDIPPEDIEKQVYAEALRKAAHDYEELIREFSILRMLNDSIQIGLDFSEICQKLVQFVTEMMNVENASVMVFDTAKEELTLLAAKSILEDESVVYGDRAWPGKTFKIGEGVAGKAIKEKRSILIDDIMQDSRYAPNQDQKVNVRSILCIPLIHEDRVHGVLNISNSSPGAFTQRKEHALTVIASTASVALSYALTVEEFKRLNQELSSRNRELGAVIELSELLHANLELDVVFEESLQTVMEAFDVDGASIFLREETSSTASLKASKSKPSMDLSQIFILLNQYYGQEIIASGKPFLLSGLTDELVGKEHQFPRHINFAGLPLFSGEHCSGILMIISFQDWLMTETQTKLLMSFCSQIGMALHNGRLILRLRENIDELQETRRKLIQSDKLALLGEMLSGVAHEINNPLAAIQGYSDLLIHEKTLSATQTRMLEKIILCVDRTRKIVQGLLSFARKTELQKRPANIHELLDRVLEHREHDFKVHNIEIVKHWESREPVALVDPNQIEQVFLNLLNNAFDSMAGKRGGKLCISTRLKTDRVQIEFADTGGGIPAKDRKKIFEPFYTTKEAGKGTGLGLSISYGIIKEHGGDLYVDEHYQDGTKMVVVLPLAPEEDCSAHDENENVVREQPERKGRVLAIDDEEVVLDFLQAALTQDRFVVEIASDGEQASRLLKDRTYDLIISDIKMPGALDGRGLFLWCQKEKPRLAERFIFITGDIAEAGTSSFLQQSGRPFLLKPFPIRDLRKVVNETLLRLSQMEKDR